MDAGDRLMLDSVLGHQRSRRHAVRGMTAQDLRAAEQAGPTGFRRFGAPKSAPGPTE